MTSESSRATEATQEPGASPQEISGVFRGSADGETSLKEKEKSKKTEQGISARSILDA